MRKAKAVNSRRADPFLPYDPDLFVADISETHIALLNKFNVIDHHLLIVTRRFELQEALLNLVDFVALFSCMVQFDGLGFYNGGPAAGASQRHKHLQIVPLPLDESGSPLPIEPLLAAARMDGFIGTIPGLPFPHAFARLDPLVGAQHDEGVVQGGRRGLWQIRILGREPGDDQRRDTERALLLSGTGWKRPPRSLKNAHNSTDEPANRAYPGPKPEGYPQDR